MRVGGHMTTARGAFTVADDERRKVSFPPPLPFSGPVFVRVLRIARRGGGRAIEPPLPRVCPPFLHAPFLHSHAEGDLFSKGEILRLIKLHNSGIDLRKFD